MLLLTLGYLAPCNGPSILAARAAPRLVGQPGTLGQDVSKRCAALAQKTHASILAAEIRMVGLGSVEPDPVRKPARCNAAEPGHSFDREAEEIGSVSFGPAECE
jgi:hypothetical protein